MDFKELHKGALKYANEETYESCGPMKLKYDVMENGEVRGTDVTPGYCGFASIRSNTINHPFIKYLLQIGFLKIEEDLDKDMAYYWVGIYSQSYEHKNTFAKAYVKYINEAIKDNELNLYSESRLD